ncbi:MAG: hypothetical protein NXI28_15910 [bacterium]|nr:hypothetical protein [bacterium]
MAVEGRQGTSNQYYTKVRRVGGKLEKRYVGRLSNPIVDVSSREARLSKATAVAHRLRVDAEMVNVKRDEHHFIKIAQASSGWKVLVRIINLRSTPARLLRMSTVPTPDLPKLQEFTRVCRLANQGDEAATTQLREWVSVAPELFAKATNALELARETLLGGLAGEAPETLALLRVRLEQEADELVHATEDEPLIKHFAETVVLAKMDLVRCQLAGLRPNLGIRAMRYWEGAIARSQKRWANVSKAFQQAVAEQARQRGKKT